LSVLHFFLPLVVFSQSTVKKLNGYKGIWFKLGQFPVYGDKFSGGLGTLRPSISYWQSKLLRQKKPSLYTGNNWSSW